MNTGSTMLTVEERKAQIMAEASKVFAEELLKVLSSDPREAAERAFVEGGPSVDELEQRIIRMQAEKRAQAETRQE